MRALTSPADQGRLRELALERLHRSRPGLPPGSRDLTELHEMIRDDEGVAVVSVVRDLEVGPWMAETCRFAGVLPAEEARAWVRSFTRTLFLAGTPAHLGERFGFAHVAPDGSNAWTGPAGPGRTADLRRLLKTLHAPVGLAEHLPERVRVPGEPTGRTHRLLVATAGLTLAEGLVHLNHLLAEAVIDGLIAAGDDLVIEPVPWLGAVPRPGAVRVAADPRDPTRLRAYAALVSEDA